MRSARKVLGIAAIALSLSLVGYQVLAVGPAAQAEGEHKRAFLGVIVDEETELEQGGARVTHVVPDSAAERAGILEGDVIVSIEGESIYGPMRLTRRLHEAEPGQAVEVEVLRDGSRVSLIAELGERSGHWSYHFSSHGEPFDLDWDHEAFAESMEKLGERLGEMDLDWDAQGFAESMEGLGQRLGEMELHWDSEGFERQMEQLQERLENLDLDDGAHGHSRFFLRGGRPLLGVQLVDTTPELREHMGGTRDAGVLVGRVIEGTPAEIAGLRAGDLIESVDGQPVGDAFDLVRILDDREGETLSIDLIRDGSAMSVTVTLDRRDEPSGPRA